MTFRRWTSFVGLIACVALTVGATSSADGWTLVRVDPAFGAHEGPIAARLTAQELRVVSRIERIVSGSTLTVPQTARMIGWWIEPVAVGSRTLALSREVLVALQRLLEHEGWITVPPTAVVIARTQAYINDTLKTLGCFPNLVRTGGVHLMGETVCGHRVVVINLTGYLFLRSVSDRITPEMESRPEPTMSRVGFRLADRNISGLAHEWAHVARAAAAYENVPADEPAWMREGFAELMAGIARVRAFPTRMTYLTFHVVRLRKFAPWTSACVRPLRSYRVATTYLGGCEYYVGTLAVELLLANHGGIPALFRLYALAARGIEFATAFRQTYGFDLSTFEAKADTYLSGIRRVDR